MPTPSPGPEDSYEAYKAAQEAFRRARSWEAAGELDYLGTSDPGPVQAAMEALVLSIEVIREADTATAQAAYDTARAAWAAWESAADDDPESEDQAWDTYCLALDALWLVLERG